MPYSQAGAGVEEATCRETRVLIGSSLSAKSRDVFSFRMTKSRELSTWRMKSCSLSIEAPMIRDESSPHREVSQVLLKLPYVD